jgi:hypothetical protein
VKTGDETKQTAESKKDSAVPTPSEKYSLESPSKDSVTTVEEDVITLSVSEVPPGGTPVLPGAPQKL